MRECKTDGCTVEPLDSGNYCIECITDRQVFIKNDRDKPRMELLDPDFMIGVANVLTFGAEKYDAYNWQKADTEGIERIKGAMLRHQMAYMNGEITDPETGLNHMYHISCNAMFLAYFDRHKTENPKQAHIDFEAE